MMKDNIAKTLIVVDMQNDFIDGSLGTAEAVQIVDKVKAKIDEYKNRGDKIIYTRDTHQDNYLSTNEGKHLPVVHCIEGTQGWEIRDGLYVEGSEIINKPAFGYTGWADYDFEDVEIIVESANKPAILEELKTIGIDESSMFPEMEHIMSSVNQNCIIQEPDI